MTFFNSLLSKAAQGGPPSPEQGPTPLKDPRPASYSFFGRDPRAFFFSRGDFENKPTDKSVAQVTHILPLAQMKWDDSNQ